MSFERSSVVHFGYPGVKNGWLRILVDVSFSVGRRQKPHKNLSQTLQELYDYLSCAFRADLAFRKYQHVTGLLEGRVVPSITVELVLALLGECITMSLLSADQ